ncbi:MOB kinase activator-like 3 isoform X5 [Drosophila willistoni]|uniref:MOB kinase activator-like 3 isoform X5 n=1 Tax=Drosophila willistoni TaxID=7260 RepID=UPI001F082764|nr:MOB kinase activator-like 3 isoform X5 [Drosophila willistoni]
MSLNGFLEFFHQGRTFRPKKRFTSGTIRYSLHKQAQASLQSGINLRQVVRLPEGEILNDWLAVHDQTFRSRSVFQRSSFRFLTSLLCAMVATFWFFATSWRRLTECSRSIS